MIIGLQIALCPSIDVLVRLGLFLSSYLLWTIKERLQLKPLSDIFISTLKPYFRLWSTVELGLRLG